MTLASRNARGFSSSLIRRTFTATAAIDKDVQQLQYQIERIERELKFKSINQPLADETKKPTHPSDVRLACTVLGAIYPTTQIANNFLLPTWQPAYIDAMEMLATNYGDVLSLSVLPATLPPAVIAFMHTSVIVGTMVKLIIPTSKKVMGVVIPEASSSVGHIKNFITYSVFCSAMVGTVHYAPQILPIVTALAG